MTSPLPYPVIRVIEWLEHNGHGARVAGGAVRDLLQGKTPNDYDVATTARPEVVFELFRQIGLNVIATGIDHGTVTVMVPDDEPGTPKNLVEDHEFVWYPIEITTLRIDQETDGRHAVVEFTDDWQADAARRDFTINAMFMEKDGTVHDYFGGQEDLKARRVTFVGKAEERIQEDYLRILRYYRFLAKFDDFDYHDHDRYAISSNLDGLKKISGERIWAELSKLVLEPSATDAWIEMVMDGVFPVIGFPYVGGHSFARLRAHTDDLTTLLVGSLSPLGYPKDHRELLQVMEKRLHVSRHDLDKAAFLVENYDRHGESFRTARDYERVILHANSTRVRDIQEFTRLLAILHGRYDLATVLAIWGVPQCPITGKVLIEEYGFEPGPVIGYVRKHCLDLWIDSGYTMSKEKLIGKAREDLQIPLTETA